MAKISVIVPVYNVEKFLEKCLNSIVDQTFKDLEIICVNDGSPDNSIEILNRFAEKDSRIKIISQENAGLSAARNTGMQAANGDYISFVDSDDWLDLNFYEKLYEAAEKYDADIVAAGIKRVRSYKWKYHLKIDKEEVTDDLNRKFLLCDVPNKCYVWNKIYKLDKLKEAGLDFEKGVCYEDRCFTANVLIRLNKIVVVPGTYYNYWTNSNSIVKTRSPKKIQDAQYTKDKMMSILKENNINLDHFPTKTEKHKIFGLTVVKINYYKNKKQIILFNQLKFFIK